MKQKLMDILICPHCRSELKLSVFSKSSGETEEGMLTCKCGRWYPIINGIPRMLPDALREPELRANYHEFFRRNASRLPSPSAGVKLSDADDMKKRTAKSFGFQWNTFSEMFPEFGKTFREYFEPHVDAKKLFNGRLCLDVGCGYGRFAFHAAKLGAEVIALDLSMAVDAAKKTTAGLNVHVVQGDACNPPFKNSFDVIYSIGVIHHMPDPRGAFLSLSKFAKKGTQIYIWVYGSEGRAFKTKFLEGTVRKVTVKMSPSTLYYFCYLPAALYHTSNTISRFFNYAGAKGAAGAMPFKNYARFPFRVKHADAYDFLGTPVNNYYTGEEMKEWFNAAKLKKICVESLKGRSWKCFGVKK